MPAVTGQPSGLLVVQFGMHVRQRPKSVEELLYQLSFGRVRLKHHGLWIIYCTVNNTVLANILWDGNIYCAVNLVC